ncbi:MAG: flavin reductase family protein [Elusimicrobia bacterium]|nr:flavin reductase family protein [Candidatus Liberimonas magnetica]
MFKKIPNEEFYRLINFGPCVIVTSKYKGKTNAAPIAWTMPVNDEPQLLAIAVAETHFTKELIAKSGSFVVNVVSGKALPTLKRLGNVSGRKTDKLKKFKVETEKGTEVDVPHLKECIGFIECRVKDGLLYSGVRVFIAKAVCSKVKPEFYKNGLVLEKAGVVHHIGKDVFAVTGKRIF